MEPRASCMLRKCLLSSSHWAFSLRFLLPAELKIQVGQFPVPLVVGVGARKTSPTGSRFSIKHPIWIAPYFFCSTDNEKSKFRFIFVSVTFFCTETKYQAPLTFKGGKVYFRSQFIEVSVCSWLVPSNRGMAEGHHRGGTVHSNQAGDSRAVKNSSKPAFLLSLCIPSRLQAYWWMPPTPRVRFPLSTPRITLIPI